MSKAPRYFEPIGYFDFIQKVNDAKDRTKEEGTFCALFTTVEKDLKVEFDRENTAAGQADGMGPEGLMGHVSLGNGLEFWGLCAGGDWEFPVYFIVYWDGRKLRGYVPTAGNPWNTTTKRAYGNDVETDLKDALKRGYADPGDTDFDAHDCDFEPGKILDDILGRIKRRGK